MLRDKLNDARAHFVSVAIPSFESFLEGLYRWPLGLRKDFTAFGGACVALASTTDYVFNDPRFKDKACFRDEKTLSNHLCKQSPAFALALECANTFKHHTLRRPRRIKGPHCISERWGLLRGEDQFGEYWTTCKILAIATEDGRVALGDYMLANAFSFFSSWLVDQRILPSKPLIRACRAPNLPRQQKLEVFLAGQANEFVSHEPFVGRLDAEAACIHVVSGINLEVTFHYEVHRSRF